MASFSSLRSEVFTREERRQHYGSYIKGLSAYDRHKKFMDDFVQFYPGSTSNAHTAAIKTDMDTLRETYRFIRTEEDDAERTWEQRLAKRYYDKLFKEYCIADMSRYKESKGAGSMVERPRHAVLTDHIFLLFRSVKSLDQVIQEHEEQCKIGTELEIDDIVKDNIISKQRKKCIN